MACGCSERAKEAFLDAGFVVEGDEFVKGDDRVKIADVEKHHARETVVRPEVVVAAANAAKERARKKLADLMELLS